MNKKISFILLGLFFILIFAFPLNVSGVYEFFTLPLVLSFSAINFTILFAAYLSCIDRLKPYYIAALLIGSFLSGPLVTLVIAAWVVFERFLLQEKDQKRWFLLKDIYLLALLGLSCGLNEQLRLVVTLLSVLGLSLDFDRGGLAIVPAILFSQTAHSQLLSPEITAAISVSVLFFHFVWIYIKGKGEAALVWKNILAVILITNSFLIGNGYFLLAVMIAALDFSLTFLSATQKMKTVFYTLAAIVFSGGAFLINQKMLDVFIQNGIFYAVPLFSTTLVFAALSYIKEEPALPSFVKIQPWFLSLVMILSLDFIWTKISLQTVGIEIAEDALIIEQGLMVLGLVMGWVIFRYFSPSNKEEKFISLFEKVDRHSSRFLFWLKASSAGGTRDWGNPRYQEPHFEIEYFSKKVVYGFLIIIIFWLMVRL